MDTTINKPMHYYAIIVLMLMWLSPLVYAQTTLDKISFSALPGDRVQVKLDFSSPVSEPLSFSIDNPARIALDFPQTKLNLDKKSTSIGIGMAHSITAVEAGGRTRVVLNLVRTAAYTMRTEGSSLYVTVEAGGGADAAITRRSTVAAPSATMKQSTSEITNIDFRRGETGEGRVLVSLSDPSTVIDIREEGGRIIVDFINSSLPENLDRRLDVVDFATPIKTIDTTSAGNNVHMVITPTGDFEHLAYQSNDLLTIEVRSLSKAEQEAIKRKKFGFTGERLSLNFQNIEVRAVLQLIADFTGLNMVASDTVTGTLTLRLKNVPWDQALDIILKAKG